MKLIKVFLTIKQTGYIYAIVKHLKLNYII